MDNDTAVSQPPNHHTDRHGENQRRRGVGRRARGNGSRNAALAMRPASVAPAESGSEPEAGQNRRRHDGARRPTANRARQTRTVNGRQFGGQLTSAAAPADETASSQHALQASAHVFVPGAAAVPIDGTKDTRSKQPRQKPKQRRFSKSQAPDIATRTHEDIDHGHYECPICTSEVQRNSKVWSCHTCWTVFHLACVKKWSSNQLSAANEQTPDDGNRTRQWRCPGCNLPKDDLPKAYTCWCEKETDPRSLAGLPPHSCGQTCGRERARKCPHPCQLTCHAGPCPPCTHMGPTQMCFCGKHETTKRCSETDYVAGWSCGEICGEMMLCGEHTCPQPCHEGICGACEVRIPAKCYCGQVEREIICAERGDDQETHRSHLSSNGEQVQETWTGRFECDNLCQRYFDCGVHQCQKSCHASSNKSTHCPRSPDVVSRCPCGKTPLSQISSTPRLSCQDDIHSCNEPCHKQLPCGHFCTQICHTGDCSTCMKVVSISCRCGRTTSPTICHQGQEEHPQCMRTCRTTLNCGRHACDERCCTGERKAIERQSTKRKQRPLNSAPRPIDDGFEAEHICTRQCGRLLKCGNHICEELCHKGPCGSCREAIFNEVSCHCGRTVLQPPLPCGTEAPPCRYQCERLKSCGHPQVAHNCHEDNVTCPKCPYLMEKKCMCGKKSLKNQQCWLQDVRCGEVCGKKLRCGSHFCRKPCHRPGECEDAHGAKCQQPCGKEKKICGHPDGQPCHAPFPCQEDKPCQSKIFITCECQAQKQESKCGACKTSEGNALKKLSCNDECVRLERNRRLALALNIDQSAHVDGLDHIPYSNETLKAFALNVKWAQTQEREYRVFATSDNERRMRFKPMKAGERAFLHSLAEDFGFDSESMDPEPYRHVMIWKTPRFVSAPNKTLSEALRIRQSQRQLTSSAPTSDVESTKKNAAKQPPSQEPYNAFLITRPRFALTIDEVRTEIAKSLPPGSDLSFDIEFLPSEEVALKAVSLHSSRQALQSSLVDLKPALASAITAQQIGIVQLCTLDSSLNILRRESDSQGGAMDGWSRVAAKKAAPRTVPSTAGTAGPNNSFAALTGSKVTLTTMKKKVEKTKRAPVLDDVVDDWEAAVREDEARVSAGEDQHVLGSVDADEGRISAGEEQHVLGSVGADEVKDVAGDAARASVDEEDHDDAGPDVTEPDTSVQEQGRATESAD